MTKELDNLATHGNLKKSRRRPSRTWKDLSLNWLEISKENWRLALSWGLCFISYYLFWGNGSEKKGKQGNGEIRFFLSFRWFLRRERKELEGKSRNKSSYFIIVCFTSKDGRKWRKSAPELMKILNFPEKLIMYL